MSRASRAALAALLALATTDCRDQPKRVVYDLVARAAVAERRGAHDVLLFGTPQADRRLAGDYRRGPGGTADEPSLVAGGAAEVIFEWATPEDRVAVVDAAAVSNGVPATVEVHLNDVPVGTLRLAGRRRHRLGLPREAQRAGENRLRFTFPDARDAGAEGSRAVRLFSLTVGLASDPSIEDYLARDAIRPFGVDRVDEVPRLHLAGPAEVAFALRLPEAAELRFTPSLAPSAGLSAGAVDLRVRLDRGNGEETDLWSGSLDYRQPSLPEQVVSLPGRAGDLVRLRLVAGGVPGDRFTWSTWGAPRVLGRGHPDPLEPAPLSAEDDARAGALRTALRDVNVVLVILDAARADHFGAYGYGRPTTPEIDRIADEGVVFEQAYTPAVYTLAALSSLWTSQHPDRHHRDLSFSARLPDEKLTLAELLSSEGIFTLGFTANAMTSAAFGLNQGFEEFHEVFQAPDNRASAFRQVVPPRLEALQGRRFFAYVHFREPHFPYDPEPPFDTRFGPEGPIPLEARRDWSFFREVNQGRRPFGPAERTHLVSLYDGNLAFVDREVGALRSALETEGLWERSVVIITADHGEELFEHGFVGHNVHVFEPSVHIPLIVRFPRGTGPAGVRVGGYVDLRDLAPTVADVFGVRGRAGSDRAFAGRSLLPVVAGAPTRRAVLSRTVWDRPRYALREGEHTYLLDTRTGEERLYDRGKDPGETRDVGDDHPIRVAVYRQSLHHWMRQPGPRGPEAREAAALTSEQCRNLKRLGYLEGECE